MKLFIVIYLAGLVGGAVGPLPYDMAECQLRAAELQAAFAKKRNDPLFAAEVPEGISFVCELHGERPALEASF